jgi:hypothetical protein
VIEFRCRSASARRKISLKEPGIRRMSDPSNWNGRDVMRRLNIIEAVVVTSFVALCSGATQAGGGAENTKEFSARLSGFQELGGLNAETGAILTDGTGTLQLDLDKNSANYTLTYSGLTSNVTQTHIHFGKVHVPGGVMVFFCTNLGNGPAGTPVCPPTGGTVTGTWTAASVIAMPGQNVPAGNFDALVDALTSNTAYANVHTVNFPAGEIRGQVRKSEKDQN